MSFSFSQALISDTCPLTQPMGSDGQSQVTLQFAQFADSQATRTILRPSFNFKLSVSRSMRERASCHRISSAKTCATQPARSSADLALPPDRLLFLAGPRRKWSRSL